MCCSPSWLSLLFSLCCSVQIKRKRECHACKYFQPPSWICGIETRNFGCLLNYKFCIEFALSLEILWQLWWFSLRSNLPRIWEKFSLLQTSGALLVSEYQLQPRLITVCSLFYPRELWHLSSLITLFFFSWQVARSSQCGSLWSRPTAHHISLKCMQLMQQTTQSFTL